MGSFINNMMAMRTLPLALHHKERRTYVQIENEAKSQTLQIIRKEVGT